MVDSWKAKSWYLLLAPKFFNEKEVAHVPATEEDILIDRIIEIPLKEITRDISHSYTNVRLRVSEIKDKTAYTKFIGHAIAREYIRTLIRRKTDVLNVVTLVKSKEGTEFYTKSIVITKFKCSGKQKTALRNALETELKKRCAKTEFGTLIQEMIYGKLGAELYRKLKKIAQLRKVEIVKTRLKEEFDIEEKQELPTEEKEKAEEETSNEASGNIKEETPKAEQLEKPEANKNKVKNEPKPSKEETEKQDEEPSKEKEETKAE